MADEIGRMTAELARNPASLVFLQLGEALRLQGQLDAAARVARSGVERHPDRPDALDLYARVLADAGNRDGARETWDHVLTLAPRHPGALKGLAYLAYRERDYDAALDMLETALSEDPADQAVVLALQTARAAAERQDAEFRLRTGSRAAGRTPPAGRRLGRAGPAGRRGGVAEPVAVTGRAARCGDDGGAGSRGRGGCRRPHAGRVPARAAWLTRSDG